jgi:hypothetical protein
LVDEATARAIREIIAVAAGWRAVTSVGMRIVLGLVVGLLLAAACRPTYFGDAIPYPAGCDDLQRERAQCDLLVDTAKAQLGVSDNDITAVDLLTDDRCGDDRFDPLQSRRRPCIFGSIHSPRWLAPMDDRVLPDRRPEAVLLAGRAGV